MVLSAVFAEGESCLAVSTLSGQKHGPVLSREALSTSFVGLLDLWMPGLKSSLGALQAPSS